MLIGFGAGAGKLVTHVEGYQMTAQGKRLLGQREIEATGGKAPGMLVPVIGGAVAGRAGMAAAVSGTMNVAQELGPESLQAAAKRTADAISKELAKAFARRQWIPAYMAE